MLAWPGGNGQVSALRSGARGLRRKAQSAGPPRGTLWSPDSARPIIWDVGSGNLGFWANLKP
eukprot:8423826-Pyramimonas_sp.AAC.1